MIRVAIIDTGFNVTKNSKVKYCDETLNKDFTTTGMEDRSGHGSHVANSIADFVSNSNLCFIIIKAFDPFTPKYFKDSSSRNEFNYALQILNPGDVLNYSAGGNGSSVDEKLAIYKLLKRGVKIFTAAGNEGANLDKDCNYYPACYHLKGLNIIGNIMPDGKKDYTSNYGSIITEWELGGIVADNGTEVRVFMVGTSQATARASAKYIKGDLK